MTKDQKEIKRNWNFYKYYKAISLDSKRRKQSMKSLEMAK